jgi:hypothetical protein
MAFEKRTTPTELLFRWRDGKLYAAHAIFSEEVLEDGKVIASREGDALSVAVAEQQGFPLADALQVLHVDALRERDSLLAQLDERDQQRLVRDHEVSTELSRRDGVEQDLRAQIVVLEGKLKEALAKPATAPAPAPAPADAEPAEAPAPSTSPAPLT